MTEEQQAEYAVLKATTDDGVFALEVGAMFEDQKIQTALERMQYRGWVRLLDISQLSAKPGLFRVFKASDEAMTWYRSAN